MRLDLNGDLGLKTYALVEYDNKLIFSDFLSNGLFEYNFNKNKADFIRTFKTRLMWNSYWQACIHKEEVWFIPFRVEERIAIYNINSNIIDYIEIPASSKKCEYRPFSEVYLINNCLYIVPCYYDCMLKIEISSRKIFRIDIGLKKYAGDKFGISYGSCKIDNKIYICPYNNMELCCYDTETDKSEVICGTISAKTYMHILEKDNHLYLIPEKIRNGILNVDIKTCKIMINKFNDNEEIANAIYSTTFISKNKIYMLPENSNHAIIIDLLNMSLEIIYIYYNGLKKMGWYKSRSTSLGEIVVPLDTSTPMLLVNEDGIHQLSLRPEKDYFMKVLRSQMELD